jgi:hypothetical protein
MVGNRGWLSSGASAALLARRPVRARVSTTIACLLATGRGARVPQGKGSTPFLGRLGGAGPESLLPIGGVELGGRCLREESPQGGEEELGRLDLR